MNRLAIALLIFSGVILFGLGALLQREGFFDGGLKLVSKEEFLNQNPSPPEVSSNTNQPSPPTNVGQPIPSVSEKDELRVPDWEEISSKELISLEKNMQAADHFCESSYGLFQIKDWNEGEMTVCYPPGRPLPRNLALSEEEPEVNISAKGRTIEHFEDQDLLPIMLEKRWMNDSKLLEDSIQSQQIQQRQIRSANDESNLASTVKCFTNTKGHNGNDVFCQILNAKISHGNVFARCQISPEGSNKINRFPSFMYGTGLANSFRTFKSIQNQLGCNSFSNTIAAIVLRDGDANLFHMYAEFFAFFLTTEVLGISPEKFQVILIDTRSNGYEFEVWKALTGKNAKRMNEIPSDVCFPQAIYTIPGGSSPMWRGSWHAFGCSDSHLFQRFVQIISSYYNLPPFPSSTTLITVIKRRSRTVTNMGQLIEQWKSASKLASKFQIEEVDFETMSYVDQIKKVRETSIFVGLHGAGLTHLMFLPSEAVVVEIRPGEFGSHLFRNLAKLCGKVYLRAQTKENFGAQTALDHSYSVNSDVFNDVMDAAAGIALNFGSTTGSFE